MGEVSCVLFFALQCFCINNSFVVSFMLLLFGNSTVKSNDPFSMFMLVNVSVQLIYIGRC